MKYRLLLTNKASSEEAEIVVPARLNLEDLSIKIKMVMELPLTDHGWHKFYSHGIAYMPCETNGAEQEILFECNLFVGHYRRSEYARLYQLFTVLGSTITYIQDAEGCWIYKICCTLLERI